METLIANMPTFQVTNPRDAVFAIITLVREVKLPLKTPVDYNKSVAQICKDVVRHTILEDGCLDVICRPWAPVCPDLPSWISQVSRHAFAVGATGNRGYYRRINADSLVGRPKRSIYSASFTTHAVGDFSDGGEGLILTVRGFELDTILSLEEPSLDGKIPGGWIEALMEIAEKRGGQSRGDGDGPLSYMPEWSCTPDLFWRTLVADRGPDGNAPPGWYRRACEVIYIRNNNGDYRDWDTASVIENPIEEGSSSTITAFLRRLQSVTWNRRLVLTQRGSVGIAPTCARPCDEVCILFGCSVPVILRQHEDGYEFIGECYINSIEGVMDGLDRIKEGKYAARYFNLK